jgi:hypothetical protein
VNVNEFGKICIDFLTKAATKWVPTMTLKSILVNLKAFPPSFLIFSFLSLSLHDFLLCSPVNGLRVYPTPGPTPSTNVVQ